MFQRALSFYVKKSGLCRATANFAGHDARVRSNSFNSTRILLACEITLLMIANKLADGVQLAANPCI
jgi:hypothetical protein